MSQTDSRGRFEGTDTHSTYGTTRLAETSSRISPAALRRRRRRRWWRRKRRQLRRLLERVLRTITPLGWFALSVTLICAILALRLAWVEALVVATIGGVALLAAIPFLLGGRAYLVRITVGQNRIVTGKELGVDVEIENSGIRPALPAIAELPLGDAIRKIPVPLIGPRSRTRVRTTVRADRRGIIDVGPFTLARRDPLGLLNRDLIWRDRHRVYVHPLTVRLPTGSAGLVRDLEGPATNQLTDSDLSFHAVREYVPGDQMRHVHWKSTAKTGSIMVRQYEESQTARAALLFDSHLEEYASEGEFELAVAVAASLSLQTVQEGRERFIVSGWTPPGKRPSVDGLEEIPSLTPTALMDSWAELEGGTEGARIEWLTRVLAGSTRDLSIVTLVTGSRVELTRLRRAVRALPSQVQVRVIRCEELAEPGNSLIDGTVFFTVGALNDLPLLLAREAGR